MYYLKLRQTGEYKLGATAPQALFANNINENILENTIEDYINKDCVYIIKIKDDIYKFGYSSKLDIRLSTHKNKLDYEKKIRIYILDNINQAIKLEKQLKYFFRKNNMLIKFENQKEIFQTDDIDNVIEKIDKFAESIKNKNIDNNNDVHEDDSITEKYNDELKLELEKEKTKQIISNNNVLLEKEKTKQLELEIEFYKLKNNII